jgi:hypothetical protein
MRSLAKRGQGFDMRVARGLVLSIAAMAQAAAAQTPIAVVRSTQWAVSQEGDLCHAIAGFGQGETQIIAEVIQFQPSSSFDLNLYSKSWGPFPWAFDATVDFAPEGNPRSLRAVGGLRGDLQGIFLSALRLDDFQPQSEGEQPPPVSASQENLANELRIMLFNGTSYRLGLLPMGPPMAELRTCTENLVRQWGFDPKQQAGVQRRTVPIGAPGSWVTAADYPEGLNRTGASAIVHYRLDVDPQGNVSRCTVQGVTGFAQFGTQTCDLITARAHFQPALDSRGRPISSYFLNTVRWLASGGNSP